MTEAPATFADVVSPLGEDEFLGLLRRRELAFRPQAGADRYAPLVGWQALRRLLESGEYPSKRSDDIRVTRESAFVPPAQWMTDGKIDVKKLDGFLAKGFSLVVLHIDRCVPALGAICDEIRSRTGEGSFVGAIVTSGAASRAFKTHYDPEDLVILQIEGTKRWKVFGPPVPAPLRGMPRQKAPETDPIFDEVLEPGDLLYVPAGNWHHCECGLSTSVHLGIFFLPPAPWHALQDIVKPLLADQAFRTPLTRLGDPAALEAMEAEMKRSLIDKISALKLSEFLADWPGRAY